MFNKVYSAALSGIHALVIQVEADVSEGLPVFSMVGYLSYEVKEARERVKTAIKNSGYRLNPKHITINLSPADVRKEGTAFDLPIAMAVLMSYGFLLSKFPDRTMIVGELGLDGSVSRVNGILPIVFSAREQGFLRCIVPLENALEGALVQDIEVIGVKSLSQAVDYLGGKAVLEPAYVDLDRYYEKEGHMEEIPDFMEVSGQAAARRALEVAVSGQHNLLMIGPPGSGKTMLAKRIPGIMPKLCMEESLEISKIYSVSGNLDSNHALLTKRPFRAPHHTITTTALAGGGAYPKPGEISLAAHGVLFLDELPEFSRNAIESLRQPMEDKLIRIARLNASYTYPANFMLVAAMNPCPCGFYPDRSRCSCPSYRIRQYIGKVSQPLLDRIDLCVELPWVDFKELGQNAENESSANIRNRVERARQIQQVRYQGLEVFFNSHLTIKEIKTFCVVEKAGMELLEEFFGRFKLSARAYHRIIKVARTIADLDESEPIKSNHIAEAIHYRVIDQAFFEGGRI